MRDYKAKPPDREGNNAGRIEGWRNQDGTWSVRLCNAQGTSSFESAELDPPEVAEWFETRVPIAVNATPMCDDNGIPL